MVATLKRLPVHDTDSVNPGYSDMQSNWIKQADGSPNGLPSSKRSSRSSRSKREQPRTIANINVNTSTSKSPLFPLLKKGGILFIKI
jgi:hypothetical protein